MSFRYNAVLGSSVLFTVALLLWIPLCLFWVSVGWASWGRDVEGAHAFQVQGDFGFASLAVIVIALIVVWKGYVNRVRWAWFVMFIVVWLWAFPVIAFPVKYGVSLAELPKLVSDALREHGIARNFVEVICLFLLMVVALFLPIKSFFWKHDDNYSVEHG